MIRIKARSAKIVGTRPSTLLSVVTDIHLATRGFHVKRSYECVKPREPKIFKIGDSPARHLSPNHVSIELRVVYKKIKGRG
jgi:hypothetical protein